MLETEENVKFVVDIGTENLDLMDAFPRVMCVIHLLNEHIMTPYNETEISKCFLNIKENSYECNQALLMFQDGQELTIFQNKCFTITVCYMHKRTIFTAFYNPNDRNPKIKTIQESYLPFLWYALNYSYEKFSGIVKSNQVRDMEKKYLGLEEITYEFHKWETDKIALEDINSDIRRLMESYCTKL